MEEKHKSLEKVFKKLRVILLNYDLKVYLRLFKNTSFLQNNVPLGYDIFPNYAMEFIRVASTTLKSSISPKILCTSRLDCKRFQKSNVFSNLIAIKSGSAECYGLNCDQVRKHLALLGRRSEKSKSLVLFF